MPLECVLTCTSELERDRELDRRKIRELQEATKERDREYQKLKVRASLHSRLLALGSGSDQL